MRAGPTGIRAAPRRAGRDHLRRERRAALLVRRRPRPRARLALRGRQRARPPAGAFQDRHAGRLRCRGHAGRRLRRRRAAALRRAHPVAGAGARAEPVGRAPRPVRAAGPGHAPQPGTDPDPVGRGRAHAVLAAGRLPHAHGQPTAAALAAPPAARERAGAGAPARHLGTAGRPHGRGTDLRRRRPAGNAARHAQRLSRHRTHRRAVGAALGAPARAGQPARRAARAARVARAGRPMSSSPRLGELLANCPSTPTWPTC